MMRHKTKDKGDLGVARTISHLLDDNIRCCVPLSEHLPFDLIAVMPDFTTLRRVQVKYRKIARNGAIELNFRSNYYDSKRIYSKATDFAEFDCYAIFSPEEQDIFYLRVDEIPVNSIAISLRIDEPRNGQKKGIWMAKDFNNPCRIAPACEVASPVQRNPLELDEIAITKVIADLVERGLQPCLPMSHYLPFDVIAIQEDMQTLSRVRIGYETVETNPYVDQYAVYAPHAKACLFADAKDIPHNCSSISLDTIPQIANPWG